MRSISTRTRALASAALLCLALPGGADAQLLDPTGGVAPFPGFQKVGTLRVGTINTFLRNWPAPTHDGECRGRRLADFIKSSGADIVALQEVFDDDYGTELRRRLGSGDWHTGIMGYPRVCWPHVLWDGYDPDNPDYLECGRANGGLGVAVRRGSDNYPSLVRHVWYQDDLSTSFTRQSGALLTGWDTWKRKGFIHFTVAKAGTTFHFLVTHTNAGNSSERAIDARRRDLDALLDYIEREVPDGQPFLILGDLNVDDTDTRELNPLVPHPPNDRDQRGHLRREIERRFGASSPSVVFGDPSVFGRYHGHAAGQHLTYDRANNFFGANNPLPFGMTIDWDDSDGSARFDWILYHRNGSDLFLGPVSAADVRIDRMPLPANTDCTETVFVPPGLPLFLPIRNLSDHFALIARLEIWSSPLPPPPPGPPLAPPPPDMGRALTGRDGVVPRAGALENYNGRFPVHARPSPQRRGGPPDAVRIQEQKLMGTSWVDTRYWDLPTSAVPSERYDALVTVEATHNQSAAPQRFRYFARVHNATGWSGSSAPTAEVVVKFATALMKMPELATATLSEDGSCRVDGSLSWAQPSGAEAGAFLVEAGSEGAADPEVVQVGGSMRFEDLELCGGKRHYAVRACEWDADARRAYNCGAPARLEIDANVKEVAGAPACPPSVEHSQRADAEGRFQMRWPEVEGADTYVVQQARDASFADAVDVWSGAETSATLSVAPDSGAYFLRMKACRAGACHCGWRTSYVPLDSRRPE